jgi:hypothetical protein
MKLESIIKKVGGAALASMPPYGPLALAAINAILPENQKLPDSATGTQVSDSISSLPPEQRQIVLSQELKLEETKVKESGDTVRVMLTHDAKNPQSTRPYIAKHSFHVVALTVLVGISALLYAAVTEKYWIIKSLNDSWTFVAVLIGPLVYVLKAYFGAIQTEQKQRFNAANGHSIESGLSSLVNAIKK